MRRAGLLIGPFPLRLRIRIMAAAFVIAGAALALHLWIHGDGRGSALETLFYAASFVALYILVFRLIHPALVRRVARSVPTTGLRGWYLSTGQR